MVITRMGKGGVGDNGEGRISNRFVNVVVHWKPSVCSFARGRGGGDTGGGWGRWAGGGGDEDHFNHPE